MPAHRKHVNISCADTAKCRLDVVKAPYFDRKVRVRIYIYVQESQRFWDFLWKVKILFKVSSSLTYVKYKIVGGVRWQNTQVILCNSVQKQVCLQALIYIKLEMFWCVCGRFISRLTSTNSAKLMSIVIAWLWDHKLPETTVLGFPMKGLRFCLKCLLVWPMWNIK